MKEREIGVRKIKRETGRVGKCRQREREREEYRKRNKEKEKETDIERGGEGVGG